MGDAIGQILAFAIVVSISPIPIVGVILMLATPRGRTNGPAFIAGWIAGLTVVGGIVLAISGGAGATEGGVPADWVNVLKLLLGVVAVLLGLKQWRERPRAGQEQQLPGWMNTVDHFDARRAAGLGVALSAVTPKNLLLVVAAAAAIAQTGVSTADEIAALAVFVLIGTLGPAIPVALYLAMGQRASGRLEEIKGWMSHHNGPIIAVILVVIGAKLIGDAISGLSL